MNNDNPIDPQPGGTGIGSPLSAVGLLCAMVGLVCAFTPWWASNAPLGFVPAFVVAVSDLVRRRGTGHDPTVSVMTLVLATVSAGFFTFWAVRHFHQ